MDATAIAFCRDNKIPIVVFDMSAPGSLRAILEGEQGRHDRRADAGVRRARLSRGHIPADRPARLRCGA